MSQKSMFYTAILFCFIFFGIISFTYKGQTALFPLIVIFIGTILVIIKLITFIFPDLAPILDPQGVFQSSKKKYTSQKEDDDSVKKIDKGQTLQNEIRIVIWVVFFVALIYIFGFYIASAISVFLFIKLLNKRTSLIAFVISFILPLVTYLLFDKILKIELFAGILFYALE